MNLSLAKKVKFVAKVAHQGEMRIIIIPKRIRKKIMNLEGKQD